MGNANEGRQKIYPQCVRFLFLSIPLIPMKSKKIKENNFSNPGSFSTYLRESNDLLWQQHLTHPFILALYDGSLSSANFEFYVRQDIRYLSEFIKIYAFAIIKTDDPEEIEFFAKGIQSILQVEQALNIKYGKDFGLSLEELTGTPLSSVNYAYTRHLLHIATTGTLSEILAAILPCIWIYEDIAQSFIDTKELTKNHPYFDWLVTYSFSDTASVLKWLCNRLDQKVNSLSPNEKKNLEEIFKKSMQYELHFWEMSWRMEDWPKLP